MLSQKPRLGLRHSWIPSNIRDGTASETNDACTSPLALLPRGISAIFFNEISLSVSTTESKVLSPRPDFQRTWPFNGFLLPDRADRDRLQILADVRSVCIGQTDPLYQQNHKYVLLRINPTLRSKCTTVTKGPG